MNEPIFREKSLQKIKSPDNLNEYIRVANPGVWTLMAAIILLLLGFCSWAVFGRLQTVIKTDALCTDGVITCFLSEEDAKRLEIGMAVEFEDYATTGTVTGIDVEATRRSTCTITSDEDVPDGIYDVRIIVETLHPSFFLTN